MSTITIKFLGPRNDLVTALVHLYLLIMPIFLKNIPQYFDQVAAPFPDEMVEEIHRGGGGGGQEDGAAGDNWLHIIGHFINEKYKFCKKRMVPIKVSWNSAIIIPKLLSPVGRRSLFYNVRNVTGQLRSLSCGVREK